MIFTDRANWGNFTQYTTNEKTTVRLISIQPNTQTPKQRAKYCDRLWVALDPWLVATIGNQALSLPVKVEVWVPRGTTYSIDNRGYDPATFMEIIFGQFDEDEIETLNVAQERS